ncbi:MAG: hypothetical protein I3J02_11155 [Prevotella sp.]|nr:hypothetical protein [Prevotella sp.]
MANINKLEMVKTLSSNGQLTVKKGFLGLGGKAVMNNTGNTMSAVVKEYVPAEGEKLLRIINLAPQAIIEALTNEKPQETGLGNVRLEALVSEDGTQMLVQMFRFVDFRNKPISDLKTFVGTDAAAIARLI